MTIAAAAILLAAPAVFSLFFFMFLVSWMNVLALSLCAAPLSLPGLFLLSRAFVIAGLVPAVSCLCHCRTRSGNPASNVTLTGVSGKSSLLAMTAANPRLLPLNGIPSGAVNSAVSEPLIFGSNWGYLFFLVKIRYLDMFLFVLLFL